MRTWPLIKSFVCLVLVLSAIGFIVPSVYAQPYPNRHINVIIASFPGTPLDITARLFSEELGKILKTEMIMNNKPGAAMTLGTDQVVRSKKDGYTIGYTNTSGVVYARVSNPETVPYDPVTDLESLGLSVFMPVSVNVAANSPWKSFSELVDYAKKNPEKLRIATQGQGGIDHLNVEVIQSLTGARFTYVPIKGPQLVTSLLGGHVEVTIDAVSYTIPHVQAGKLRMLLVAKKLAELPDVPVITDLGYKQDLFVPWFAFFAPAGIPENVRKVLVPAIEKAIKNPELKTKVEKMGFIVDYKSPPELKALMIDNYERALVAAKKLGLRKD
jgi:tripartite-type tricarboxylate transporter receptor subunit TctC